MRKITEAAAAGVDFAKPLVVAVYLSGFLVLTPE